MRKLVQLLLKLTVKSGERGAALLMVMAVSLIIVALAAPLSITQLNLTRQHARAREAYKTLELMEQIGKVVLRSYEVQERAHMAGGTCPSEYLMRGKFCFPRGGDNEGLFCVRDYETGESELCVTSEDIRLTQTSAGLEKSGSTMVVQVHVRETGNTWGEKLLARVYRTLDRWEGLDPMDSIAELSGLPRAHAAPSSYSVEPWLHDNPTGVATDMDIPEPTSSAACTGPYCVTCGVDTECVEIQICPIWKDGKCENDGDYYRQRFAVFVN